MSLLQKKYSNKENYRYKKNTKIEKQSTKIELQKEIMDKITTTTEFFEYLNKIDHPLNNNRLVKDYSIGKYMVIGEAPGAQEDKEGIPFVGKSGKLFRNYLNKYNVLNQVYFYNIVPWRPENNRTPTQQEIDFFKYFLYKYIEIFKPKAILTAGSIAAKAIFNDKNIQVTKLRGKQLLYKNKIPIITTLHPAFILRNNNYKTLFENDIKKFANLIII